MQESDNSNGHRKSVNVRWNTDSVERIRYGLSQCSETLVDICSKSVQCQDDVKMNVTNFCEVINETVLPNCDVHVMNVNDRTGGHKRRKSECKPWFDNNCREKYRLYKEALRIYNLEKSVENHRMLMEKKRSYKVLAIRLKRQYKRQEGNMIEYIRKRNPKEFYKLFSKRKNTINSSSKIKIDQFVEHFRNLNSNVHGNEHVNEDITYDAIFDELDAPITEREVEEAIRNLKRNKSCSEDLILNEVFLECTDILTPSLVLLFNSVFESGFFPEAWAEGCIVPIHKKGDVDEPNNYRGITLISCMGKLFTSILNKRILDWDKENCVITDAQFGFKPGLSTIDAIFALQTLVNKTLKRKKRLYCCFIDYSKAFDLVDRSSLWCKLIKQGLQGKMLRLIKSLYENVKSCVKYDGCLSDYFSSKIGLFQGEVLSPILYSMYVNDCEMHFIRENCPFLELCLISIFLLMYADDTVLISETSEGLQSMLDALCSFNNEWKLSLNVSKTKIVVFRNGGVLRENDKWFYHGNEIEVVNEFNYLGLLFNYNGKFSKTQKHAADQGRKANFALSAKLMNHCFNVETQLSVFDTYVNSILNYGSEVWGLHKAPDVEKVHSSFCKTLLGVKKSTTNDLVYFELGRLPLYISRKLRIIKYWLKLRKSENCILKACLAQRILDNDEWIISIKNELNTLGLMYIFEGNFVHENNVFFIIKSRFNDVYQQNMLSRIQNTTRGALYKHLVDNFTIQYYLQKSLNPTYRKYLSKFRLSAHSLNIEKGRYNNTNRRDRICTLCNSSDIEDEFHFILKCPIYNDLRVNYIKNYYYRRPSVFKLVQLLSVNNVKIINNLGKYLYLASNRRCQLLT